MSLSNTTSRATPAALARRTKLEPMKPAPPVTIQLEEELEEKLEKELEEELDDGGVAGMRSP